jgi:hypothetical protein
LISARNSTTAALSAAIAYAASSTDFIGVLVTLSVAAGSAPCWLSGRGSASGPTATRPQEEAYATLVPGGVIAMQQFAIELRMGRLSPCFAQSTA